MKHFAKQSQLLTSFLLIGVSTTVLADDGGGLSPKDVATLQESFRMDDPTRVIYNAVTNGDVKDLALNRDVIRRNNNYFTHKIKTKGVTNQKSSGRCWLFASLNVLRPAVIEKHNLDGFWNLYDSCFDEHVYAVVVKKAYVPDELLRILDRPVTVLPPWHPMMVLFK